jgi:hypothetical protein
MMSSLPKLENLARQESRFLRRGGDALRGRVTEFDCIVDIVHVDGF